MIVFAFSILALFISFYLLEVQLKKYQLKRFAFSFLSGNDRLERNFSVYVLNEYDNVFELKDSDFQCVKDDKLSFLKQPSFKDFKTDKLKSYKFYKSEGRLYFLVKKNDELIMFIGKEIEFEKILLRK